MIDTSSEAKGSMIDPFNGGREGPFHSANHSISNLVVSNLLVSNLVISNLDRRSGQFTFPDS